MVSIMSLWLPILLSAVFVFVASSIIHMFLSYHKNNFKKVPNEAGVMDALRPFNLSPGDYMMPLCGGTAEMKSPEFTEKLKKGPVVAMTVFPNGPFSMTGSLVLWFLFAIAVSILAAYIASRALPATAHYLDVFRFAGTTAFIGYSFALLHDSIWYKRCWGTTFKFMFDGLIYGLLTGGTFGWLWPALN